MNKNLKSRSFRHNGRSYCFRQKDLNANGYLRLDNFLFVFKSSFVKKLPFYQSCFGYQQSYFSVGPIIFVDLEANYIYVLDKADRLQMVAYLSPYLQCSILKFADLGISYDEFISYFYDIDNDLPLPETFKFHGDVKPETKIPIIWRK